MLSILFLLEKTCSPSTKFRSGSYVHVIVPLLLCRIVGQHVLPKSSSRTISWHRQRVKNLIFRKFPQ